MSDWLTDFFTEFVPFAMGELGIPTAQPGAVNVLTTIQGQQHNFTQMLNANEGAGWKFVPPGMVIDVGDFIEAPTELGMAVQSLMRAPITVIYIADLGGTNTQPYVYSKMFALKKAIEARPSLFQTFTRIEQGKLMSSVDCPVNKDLMGDSQVSVICSALAYTPGLVAQLY
jgi:hypothetical protein